MKRRVLAATVLAATGAAIGYGALTAYSAKGDLARPVDVVIPRGRFAAVAASLQASGVVRSAWELRAFAALTSWQGNVRAAELAFPAGASIERVLLILRHGRPVQHLVTVPEGMTSAKVGQILAAGVGLTGDIVLPAEGAFLPETYAYERGASAAKIVERAGAAMRSATARAWATRAPDLPLHDSRELLVLASLVERETHLPAERGLVAAVFLNRLRLGMRLQSDPTVVYAASGGMGELPHALRREELDWPSGYNTYVQAGLPVGPICNPGAAAIEAAAHPARSDALYFVADGAGGHAFARSLDEHERNVARYRRLAP